MWVVFFCLAGYCFDNLPAVRDNFPLVVLPIITLPVPPLVEEAISERRRRLAGQRPS